MFGKVIGLFTGRGLTTYLLWGMVGLIATNAITGYMLKEAWQDTARVELQERLDRALAANQSVEATRAAQAAAHLAEVTELRRRLDQVNRVARESEAREAAAREELTEFEASLEARELAQPDYADWAKVELPDRIAEGLKTLTDRASAEGD